MGKKWFRWIFQSNSKSYTQKREIVWLGINRKSITIFQWILLCARCDSLHEVDIDAIDDDDIHNIHTHTHTHWSEWARASAS